MASAKSFDVEHLLLVGVCAIPGAGLRLLLAWCVEQAYSVDQPAARAAVASASYFVPNIVGCFVLGFVARAKTYAAAMRLSSAARLRYARVSELMLGAIGTGFCGSLTTFASWMTGASEALVRGEVAWAGSVLVLMLAASWAAMRLGTLAASSWLSCGEHERCRAAPCCARLAVSRALVDVGVLLAPGGRVTGGAEDARALARLVEEGDTAAAPARAAALRLAVALDACAMELDAVHAACAPNAMELQPVLSTPAASALDDAGAGANAGASADAAVRGAPTPPSAPPTPCAACAARLVAALPAAVVLGLLLASAAVLFGCDRFGDAANAASRRVVWLALLLAPAGAMLRAELGRYNPVCPPLPLCTLLANLLGCAVAALCTVGCSTLRSTHFGGESRSFVCSVDPRNAVDGVAGHALQIELAVALSAVGAGFAGSLSTTSTFVAEVLAERPAVGAAYAAASIGAAQLLLLAVNLPWRLSG